MPNTVIKPAYTHWTALSDSDFREIMYDFEQYCANSLILNKEGRAVPFILNEAQLIFAKEVMQECFAEIPNPKIIVVHKSRQIGLSVVSAKVEQYIATRRKNLRLLHMFPTDELAKKFAENKVVPQLEGTHPSLLPEVSYTRSPNVMFRYQRFAGIAVGSNMYLTGAGSRSAGRSQTFNVIMLDEYAYYDKTADVERGILATRAKSGLSLLVYISSANGVGNKFYDLCKQAREPNNRMVYLFFPWHMLKEYEMEPEGRLKELSDLSNYELRLLDEFEKLGYPVESWARKLQFYQYVYETEAKRDVEFMYREYPSFADESFAATGAPVLPLEKLINWRKEAENHPPVYIEPFQDANDPRKIDWQVVDKYSIKRWKEPQQGERYIIGIDLAMGGADGDWHAGCVLNERTLEEVCTFEDKMEQYDIAAMVLALSRLYNNAIIVPERNMGRSFIDFVSDKGGRLYVDPLSPRGRILYGIHTTAPVKKEAIYRARFLINQDIYKSYDQDFIDDALHFIWKQNKTGYAQAVASGYDENNQAYHDDTIMSRLTLFMALDMRRWGKNYTLFRETDRNK